MKNAPLLLTGLLAITASSARAQLVELNIAQGKPTFGDSAFGTPTARGNDGIDGTTDAANWTHADYPTSAAPYPGEIDLAPNPYWQVDLDGVFDLTRIQLVDRVACCDPNRLEGSTITLFDSGGVVVGTPIPVTGAVPSSPAIDATHDYDNGGAGWTGVAAVRIDGLATNQYFQFSEFRAFSMQPKPPGNAALGRPVTASGPTYGGQPPENITDGNLNTQSHPQAQFGTLGFTYTIDFGQSYNLEEIVLWNRSGTCCPERLSNYRVSLHEDNGAGLPGDAVWTADVRTDGSNSGNSGSDRLSAALDPAGTFAGQFVVVENLSDEQYNPQIAELEALTFDEIPQPPEPPKNYALNAAAGFFMMDGTAVAAYGGSPAGNAVDGNRGSFTHPADMISADYYLEIDMGEDVLVGTVAVSGRTDDCCQDRLEDARLELLDAAFNVVASTTMAGQVVATTEFDFSAAPPTARYLRIHNANGTDYGPQMTEVEVFAPVAPSARFEIVDLSADPSTGAISLTFNSTPGITYEVYVSSDAVGAVETWEQIDDNVPSGGAETTYAFTDTDGIGQPVRIYRVLRRNVPAP